MADPANPVELTADTPRTFTTHIELEATMGGKPNPGTKKDKRLKANRKSKKGKK